MCGLAGTATFDSALPPSAVAIAERMGRTLFLRGPDGAGSWGDDQVALSHQRLAILDTSDAGAQPMISASGRYVIVFNGEIYNFHELSAELTGTGWHPTTTSDTEVLLAAVERWGLDAALRRFDGMFAFALYDRTDKVVSLVRDRFGEKPLVYATRGSRLWFASEVRALEVADLPSLTISRTAVADYFRYGYVPGTQTIYHDVWRVAPASIVSFNLAGGVRNPGSPTIRHYWEVPGPPAATASKHPTGNAREGDRDEQLYDLLSGSARNRLVSDRPLGAFLSGGIDSSLTCALAAEHTSGALKTFTMGWDEAEYDESVQAMAVARMLGSNHTDVRLDRTDAATAAASLGNLMDEPHADYSQIGVLLVAQSARRDVIVALSGDGGDEMFAGYNRHAWLPRVTRMRNRIPQRARGPLARGLRAAAPAVATATRPLPVARRPRLVADKLNKLANAIGSADASSAYEDVIALNHAVGRPRSLPMAVVTAMGSSNESVALWGLRAADLHGYLPDDVLAKVDRSTMAVSLESRTPFLSADIAEYAMHLQAGDLIANGRGKQPLRRLLARLLPDADFTQPKTGFGVPIASLLRNELLDLLDSSIAEFRRQAPPAELAGIGWEGLRDRLVAGDDGSAPQLWMLVAFELWVSRLSGFPGWEIADPRSGTPRPAV